jgi:hypothetical protein
MRISLAEAIIWLIVAVVQLIERLLEHWNG